MSDYMPNELVIEILARLPVKSLLRFTSVCKSWYSIITSPSFITKHLNQSLTDIDRHGDKLLVRHYVTKDNCIANDKIERYQLCGDNEKFGDEHSELEFPFKIAFGYFRIVGSCNGLICLCDDYFCDMPRIILWNPSVRESVTLPMPYKPQGPYMFVLGFGSDPITHEYKVLRIVYEKGPLNLLKIPTKVEIYMQSTWSWREIRSAAPPYHLMEFMWSQAFVNGAVHWVAHDPCVEVGYRNLIVSFDMGADTFSEIMLPPTLADQQPTFLSVKLFGESLAVLCDGQRRSGSSCIWVMKEYGVAESWTKLYSIYLPGMFDRISGFRKNGEVLLSTSNNWLLSYDPGTKTIMSTGIMGSSHAFYVDPFMESLVLVKRQDGLLEDS